MQQSIQQNDQQHRLTHLQQLEAESIYIIREVVAEFDRPVMLYSIGKDSSVMLHLARKAFSPGPLPFPLLLGVCCCSMYCRMIEIGAPPQLLAK